MSNSVQFSSLEHDEFEEYRPTNVLAIGSLLLACVSAIALIHPLLSLVSVAAIVLSATALLPSRADAWGRPCAFFALGLAVFFASCGNTWYFYRRAVLFDQARKNGESWLKLISQQEYERAHQLSREHFERVGPDISLTEHYAKHDHPPAAQTVGGSATPSELLDQFMWKFPMDRLVASSDFQWRFEKVFDYQRSLGQNGREEKIELLYTILPPADTQAESFNVRLVAVRIVENNIAYWRIDNLAGERAGRL